jgi:hypothetical protein
VLLDRTRERAGLLNTRDEEGRRVFVATNEALARRPRPALPECRSVARRPSGRGASPIRKRVPAFKRWHCPEHVHLARAAILTHHLAASARTCRRFTILLRSSASDVRMPDAPRSIAKLEQRAHEAEQRRLAEQARASRFEFSGPGWTS